jgi:hypothetical protein
MKLENLSEEWDSLMQSREKIRKKLSLLQNEESEIERKIYDLDHKAFFSGYVLQYGEWKKKEDLRINPLSELSNEDKKKLVVFTSSGIIFKFITCKLDDEMLSELPELVRVHYSKYKTARDEGNIKEQEILLEEVKEVVPMTVSYPDIGYIGDD